MMVYLRHMLQRSGVLMKEYTESSFCNTFSRVVFVLLLTFTLLPLQLPVSSIFATVSSPIIKDIDIDFSSGTFTSTSVSGSGSSAVVQLSDNTWYNNSWLYRKKITFNNSAAAENLTNFPVLVKLTGSSFDFTKAQNSGQDIRFTDSDATTLLSYEIEKWDNSGQEAIVWVKVPQIDSASNTDNMYMYYGNSSASDSQSASSVWDANYQSVLHFKETANPYPDSTSNGLNGANINTTTTTSQIGQGVSFNGTNGCLDVGTLNSFSPHLNDVTWET